MQALAIGKILVDSLDAAQLTQIVPEQPKDSKSLRYLRIWLQQEGFVKVEELVKTLRDIWNLRHGSAPWKGSDYRKSLQAFQADSSGYQQGFSNLLEKVITLLDDLQTHFLKT